MRQRATVLAIALTGCVAASRQLPPIDTDRPDVTDGTTTVPVGTVQLEGGYTTTCSGGQPCDHAIGEGLLRLGLWSRAEARIALNSYEVQHDNELTQRGFDDVALGFKLRLYTAPDNQIQLAPSTSWIFETSIPTGTGGIGAGTYLPATKLAVEWFLGERFDLGANAILTAQRTDTGPFTQSGASVSLVTNFTKHLSGFFEWYALGGVLARHSLDAGFTFSIGDAFELDARYGGAITGSDRDRFVGVGLARRWPR